MTITFEQPHHAAGIELLLDFSFGPGRFAKTAYRLREGVPPLANLSFVALDGATGALEGTLRFWPILIGGVTPSLLLGPIAVAAGRRGAGLGATLIRMGLVQAHVQGWGSIILVGDAPYYGRFGFTRDLTRGMSMPGPVDEDRFLGLELSPGALDGAAGTIAPWRHAPAASVAPSAAPWDQETMLAATA